MAKLTLLPSHGVTQEIKRDQWIPFFAQFTREYRGAHARLGDGARSVWITFRSTPADHLTHGVHEVSAVRLLLPAGPAGPALAIAVPDGTKTVLELTEPEAYALPPGDRQEGHP